jgi:hypothetical protein
MVQTAFIHKQRQDEVIQFLTDYITICKQNDPAGLKIQSKLHPLAETTEKLEAHFKVDQGSEITRHIIALDDRRDDAIICLTAVANAFLNHFDKTIKSAAEKLDSCIQRYGNRIYRLNYRAETSTITNLVEEIERTPELLEALKVLGLTSLLHELKESNEAFNDKYLARIKERAEAPKESSVELRKTAQTQFHELNDLIDAHIIVSGITAYEPLVNQLNVLIEKYNAIVKAREESEEE